MNGVTKVVLIVIVVIALISVGGYFAISALMRPTASEGVTPNQEENQTLATRVALMMNPTPTVLPDPVTIIHEIRSLARLETIQYTVEKVITVEQGQNELSFLFGDKLLFVGHGKAIAGIDLARLRPEDMWVDGEVLNVRLPPAEIFIVSLDNDKSYVYNRDTGILTKGDVNLERTARVAAEKEILNGVVEDGILVQAQQNAETYMSRLFRSIGYPDVIFVHDATPQPQPTPQVTPQP